TGSYNSDFKKTTEVKADFDVQFFPEGGQLIAGNMQMVGFKAIARNGLGADISGRIVDEQNQEVCTFKSSHLGMGLIAISPQMGKTLSAICEDSHGQSLTVKLPAVSAEHCALVVKQNASIINISVLSPNGAARKDTLYLMANLRGLPVFQSTLLPESLGISLAKKGLSSGITQLLLLNSNGKILSERLVFISGSDKANMSLNLDKPNYTKRDIAHASILLKNSEGKPIEGNFSISVTDDIDVKIDSNETTIQSYLLLQSDLKGYIENPNWYFNPKNKNTAYQLDMLMLTQGWKRYDTAAALEGKYNTGRGFSFEKGPVITGKVQNFPARRGIPRNNVTFLVHKKMAFDMTTTDNYGHFVYQSPEYPDSTEIMVQAEKKPGAFLELVIYPDTFPKVGISCIFPDDIKNDAAMKDFLKKSRDRYFYKNGMMSVTLKDVVVTAKKVDKSQEIRNERNGGMYSMPSYTFDEESIKRATSIASLLMEAPGVMITGTGISIRNGTPLIMVDNLEYQFQDLSSINVAEVKMIDILKDPTETAMFGPKGQSGVICIYLKSGKDFKDEDKQELGRHQALIFPLGYSLPAEFYVPRYQVEENRKDPIPDLRSTIYWNPSIKSNVNGEADVFINTADTQGTYTIIAEGVSPEGEIIRYQGKLNRK
ncbi:MAG: TonB-dependent receptor plug domain-containing protein, partial [Bacteroidales bacterium]|nr:TonB-dependent receptor plug domain-containing protein [Bacteroidales bacterium]